MSDSYRPRLSVEIRPDQFTALQKILPHGSNKILFQTLIDGIIALHAKGGFQAIGAITSGHVSVVQLAEAGLPYTYYSIVGEK